MIKLFSLLMPRLLFFLSSYCQSKYWYQVKVLNLIILSEKYNLSPEGKVYLVPLDVMVNSSIDWRSKRVLEVNLVRRGVLSIKTSRERVLPFRNYKKKAMAVMIAD